MRRFRALSAMTAAAALAAAALAPAAAAAPAVGTPDGNKIWNGYVSHITKKSKAYYVRASWVVPDPKCSGPFKSTSAGTWVGLDGVNTPVVQIGILAICAAGVLKTIFPFWEVTPPQSNYQAVFHTVQAGDHIFASIQYNKGGKYVVYIADSDRKWGSWQKTVKGPKDVPHEAEWIIEAGGHPLANFGTVHFTGCIYTYDAAGHHRSLKGADKYIAGTSNGPQTKVSDPGNRNTSFTVSFIRAK